MLMLPAIVPMFTGETLDSMLTSYDMSDEIDFVTEPVVTTSRMLPCVPAAMFTVTEVSDTQLVDCTAVKPARAAMLWLFLPRFAPNKVTLCPPTVRWFIRDAMDTLAPS